MHNSRFNAGLVAGLARASEIVAEQQGEEAARGLKEIVAVAAARVLKEQQVYAELRAKWTTPEARAEVEAENERIKSGEVKVYQIEEVLHEMEEIERKARNGQTEA